MLLLAAGGLPCLCGRRWLLVLPPQVATCYYTTPQVAYPAIGTPVMLVDVRCRCIFAAGGCPAMLYWPQVAYPAYVAAGGSWCYRRRWLPAITRRRRWLTLLLVLL
jgi:hypothetical protein